MNSPRWMILALMVSLTSPLHATEAGIPAPKSIEVFFQAALLSVSWHKEPAGRPVTARHDACDFELGRRPPLAGHP